MRKLHQAGIPTRSAAGALAIAGLLAAAPAAHAGATAPTYAAPAFDAASVAECVAPPFVQPFAAFGDGRNYALVPGGDFTDASGWQLYAGARIDTTDQRDGTTGQVLTMPAGSVAISPYMCVDLDYPTARFFSRSGKGGVGVDVRLYYPGAGTIDQLQGGGTIDHDGPWAPSKDLPVKPEAGGKVLGWRLVAFVIKAKEKGTEAQLDDAYVDPRMR